MSTMNATKTLPALLVERVQTGVRMEKRLLKVLKALAELKDLSLGDLLEGDREVVLRRGLDHRRRELVERPLAQVVVVGVDLARPLGGEHDLRRRDREIGPVMFAHSEEVQADLVRQKDMLFALEGGMDLCEDAMDVIRSVVVKNG